MASTPADFPDPLNASSDRLPLDNPDELISQLAGEEIARLLGPEAQWTPQPEWTPHAPPRATSSSSASTPSHDRRAPVVPVSPLAGMETPVEELAAQLNLIFEEIRQQKHVEPPPPSEIDDDYIAAEPEPVLVMRRRDESGEPPESEDSRSVLIAPLDEDPLPPLLRPLAWMNGPVMSLGGSARLAVSVISVLSFVFSVSALAYVIALRQG